MWQQISYKPQLPAFELFLTVESLSSSKMRTLTIAEEIIMFSSAYILSLFNCQAAFSFAILLK